MLIYSLEVDNFRQFYGQQVIEFACDPGRNLTLIHGENGVGKTTILNAILWCLYEKTTAHFEQAENLMNDEARKEKKTGFSVCLTFEYEKKVYRFHRTGSVGGKPSLRAWDVTDGNNKGITNPQVVMNQIVPHDLADYFFFHGEEIGNISAKAGQNKVKNAIRDILGLTLAEVALDDLKEVRKSILKDVTKLSPGSSDIDKKQAEAEAKATLLVQQQNRMQEILEQEAVLDAQIEEIDAFLRNAPNVSAFQSERSKLEHQQKTKREHEAQLRGRLVQTIGKYGYAVFGREISERSLDFIDENSLKGKLPSPYNEQLVKDLLEQKLCICKRPLTIGSDAYGAIQDLLLSATTAVIYNRLLECRAFIQSIKTRSEEASDGIQDIQAQLTYLSEELRGIEDSIKGLSEKIKGSPVEEINKKEIAREELGKKLKAMTLARGQTMAQIGTLQNAVGALNAEVKKALATQPALAALSAKANFLEELIGYAAKRIEADEERSRNALLVTLNKTLDKFSRKDYRALLDPNTYTFHLVRQDNQKVAKSTGEKLLLSLSFIATLIEYAAMRVGQSGDFVSGGTVAPFVIDAPFGELDETYKKSVASLLPERAQQVVLLLSSSHWKGTVEKEIRPYVGAEYVLVSHVRGARGDKPKDDIEICGKYFEQSRYGQGMNQSVVEKV